MGIYKQRLIAEQEEEDMYGSGEWIAPVSGDDRAEREATPAPEDQPMSGLDWQRFLRDDPGYAMFLDEMEREMVSREAEAA